MQSLGGDLATDGPIAHLTLHHREGHKSALHFCAYTGEVTINTPMSGTGDNLEALSCPTAVEVGSCLYVIYARRAYLYDTNVKLDSSAYKCAYKSSGGTVEEEPGSAESLAERVARLIAGGETFEVEFKGESRERFNDRDLIEAVVCLANGSGGMLLVGVEDDGTVTGARPRHESGRTDMLRLQALIANMTQPPLSVVASTVQVGGKDVLSVEVPDSPRVVGTTSGTYVRRAIGGDGRPACIP